MDHVFNVRIEVHPDGSATVEDVDRKVRFSKTYWYDATRDIEHKLVGPVLNPKVKDEDSDK